MTRICIIALIGLPAAGKSSFCQQILNASELPFNVAHLRFDDLIPFNADLNYREERSKLLLLLQSVVDALKLKASVSDNEILGKIKITSHLNAQDYVILFDDNNYYTSMRYKIYQMCKAHQLCFGQVYFPINVADAMKRNADRDSAVRVPSHIVEQMAARLELPNPQHNNWELQTLILDLDSFSNEIFIDFVAKCFHRPLEVAVVTVEDKSNEVNVSPLHYLDVHLRRRIKIILDAETSREIKKQKAQLLNDQRKEILRKFNKTRESESMSVEKLDELCKVLT